MRESLLLSHQINHKMIVHEPGTVKEVSALLKSPNLELETLIDNLPKRALELKKLSEGNPDSKRMFNMLTRKSFDYLRSILDLEIAAEGDRSDLTAYMLEVKEKDTLRSMSHNAVISAIDSWIRALDKAGVNTKSLTDKIIKGDRLSYGNFAVGFALDIYTSDRPEIYFKK